MDTSPQRLKRLHEIHHNRYTDRLVMARAGSPGYRERELVELLAYWTEVAKVNFVFEALSPKAKVEVMDAIADEGED